jgi:hypothetical protein
MNDTTKLLDAALSYLEGGLSVIPCHSLQKRPRLAEWKQYQTAVPTRDEVERWFREADPNLALAVVAGRVSGNLEVLDFDAPHLLAPWSETVEELAPGLLDRTAAVRTQSGGYHLYYRAAVVEGNRKLAVDPEKPDGKYTLIETRGEGGYVLAPPSPGYVPFHGNVAALPLLAAEERELLLGAARAFTRKVERPAPDRTRRRAPRPPGVLLPGDDFNARGDVEGLLRHHGWRRVRQAGNVSYWRRPGKQWGVSATLNYVAPGVFYVFTTNAPPLEPESAYSPFALYAQLECGGDFSEAARALRGHGFGTDD